MLVHTVYFWLKPDLAPDQIRTFENLAQAMDKIPGVEHLWVGKPSTTRRPVIDSSYSYGLVVVFKDLAAHDAYQDHAIHDTFRDTCGSFWTSIKVYDSV